MAADSSHLAPSPPLIGRQVGLVPVGHLRKGHSLGPSARVATSMGSISAQLPQPRMASSNSKRPRDCFGRSARYVAELEPTPDAAAGQPVQQITVSALHQHPVTISACTDVRGRHTGAGLPCTATGVCSSALDGKNLSLGLCCLHEGPCSTSARQQTCASATCDRQLNILTLRSCAACRLLQAVHVAYALWQPLARQLQPAQQLQLNTLTLRPCTACQPL